MNYDKPMGIVIIILGMIALASPLLIGDYLLTILGVLVATVGAMRMLWALTSPGFDKSLWTFLLGILTLLAGLAILANPLLAADILAISLLIYLAADGFIEFLWGLTLQDKPGKTWLMLSGVVSLLFAFYLFSQMPVPAYWAIGVMVGVKLVFIGITMVRFGTTFDSAVESLKN